MVPLLFNICLCDLFMFTDNIDIASYADDTTPYVSGVTLDSTKKITWRNSRLDPTEWSNTLKQFVCNNQRIAGLSLTVFGIRS